MMSAIYRSLDPEQREIRLLRLHPSSSFGDAIKCSLFHSFLDHLPEYEALSYVWGPLEFSQEILVEGQSIKITENLECALRHLRHVLAERTLWVDALCINQADIVERNHQVTLMKEIYSLCICDLAWLGPNPGTSRVESNDDDDEKDKEGMSSRSLKLLQRGMQLFCRIYKRDAETLDGMLLRWNQYQDCETIGQDNEDESPHMVLSYDEKIALMYLFREVPLWSRIWVMQELSCAHRVILIAGTDTLDWDDVASFLGNDNKPYADAFHVTGGHHSLYGAVVSIFGLVQTIQQQRRIMRDIEERKYESTLMDVLARFQYADARDPRDVIYGLLGLVSEAHPIRVDYSKPFQGLFADITRFFINKHKNLDIICQNPWHIVRRSTKEDAEVLPSWVVDFTHERRFTHFESGLESMLFAQRGIFSAGASACTVPCEVLQGGLLSVGAVLLDELRPVLYGEFGGFPLLNMARNWMHRNFQGKSLPEDNSTVYPPTGEPLFRAYWRTLVMDCKAYPIERLSSDDIEADEAVFTTIAQGDTDENSPESSLVCVSMLWRTLRNWTFAMSKTGLLIMVHEGAQAGDVLAILDGGKVPCLLRQFQEGDESRYRVVHSVYIHGYMDGQVAGEIEQGRLQRKQILLA
ncbi:heterokaryon incompatibility protein-domain-containing protein [Xylaria telfairii]|nr:heterokaryon incompatibility protein-domain-containing protein [Xylaria telfairii]